MEMNYVSRLFSILFLLFAFTVAVARTSALKPIETTIKIRKNRRQSGSLFESFATSCENNCEAQFRRDFEDSLGKSYDTEFFDFPVDSLISSSRINFDTFCRLVEERTVCYREECDQLEPPINPQTHICIQQRTKFEQALSCLNATTSHLKCHAACSKAARRSMKDDDSDNRDPDSDGFSDAEKGDYREQDLRCRFQACVLHCRRQLIDFYCEDNEKQSTKETLRLYYTADLKLDLQEFQRHDALKFYPKFCRFFLASETDDANIRNQLNIGDYESEYERIMTILRLEATRSASNKYRNSYFE
ncbi:hypothetical protein DdX_12218 [Ditylenchus destructor]|uniref:Uncharacterized protein n=1 Tax=Ditylenchus destructor TaxID=166010 RepID=A0AAD4MZH8_9BILA|nr:hypothetical protein DdX_12218 [Ditylenchus destructor]